MTRTTPPEHVPTGKFIAIRVLNSQLVALSDDGSLWIREVVCEHRETQSPELKKQQGYALVSYAHSVGWRWTRMPLEDCHWLANDWERLENGEIVARDP